MSDSTPPAPTFAGATKSQVDSWRSEYGEDHVALRSVPTGKSERFQFVVRSPDRSEYNRYLSGIAKSDRSFDKMGVADRNLFAECLLAPTLDEVRAVWDQFPALADKMIEPILKLAGTEAEVREETF